MCVQEMNVDKFNKEMAMMEPAFLEMDSIYVQQVLDIKPGQLAVIANGQVSAQQSRSHLWAHR
jgi:hypothetical protein